MGLDTSSFIDEYSSSVLLPSAVSLAETRGSPVRGFRKIHIGNEVISLFGLPGPLTTIKTRIDPRGRLTRTDPTFVETILTRRVEWSWVRSDPGSQRSDRSWNRAQAACREPAEGYDKTTRTAICFEHKTQYLLIRAPYTRIVVFWHISKIPPMISQSQISCNTPTLYIAAIFVGYCYTTGSWLL